MEFDDIFLRRVYLIAALKKSLRNDFSIFHDQKTLKEIIKKIEENKDGHYLSISKDDKDLVSYAAKPNHKNDDERRVKISLGKYIRRRLDILPRDFSDFTLERLAKVVSKYLKEGVVRDVTILSGEDLKRYYRNVLKGFQNFSDKQILFYSINDKKVSWVLSSNFSRALLWNCDDGTKVLDIIYPKEKSHHKNLISWAKDNNIRIISEISPHELYSLRVTMKCHFIEEIPYQDTFKYGEINRNKEGQIILSPDPIYGNLYIGSMHMPYLRDIDCFSCCKPSSQSILSKVNGKWYCSICIKKCFNHCSICDEYRTVKEKGITEKGYSKYNNKNSSFDIQEGWACDICAGNSKHYHRCGKCNEFGHELSMKKVHVGYKDKKYCKTCITKHLGKCENCDKQDFVSKEYEKILCKECADKMTKCIVCEQYDSKYSMDDVIFNGKKIEKGICRKCNKELKRCQECWCYALETKMYKMDLQYATYNRTQYVCSICKPKVEKRKENVINSEARSRSNSCGNMYDDEHGGPYSSNWTHGAGGSHHASPKSRSHSMPNTGTKIPGNDDKFSMN